MLLIKLYFSVFDSILAQFYYKNTIVSIVFLHNKYVRLIL